MTSRISDVAECGRPGLLYPCTPDDAFILEAAIAGGLSGPVRPIESAALIVRCAAHAPVRVTPAGLFATFRRPCDAVLACPACGIRLDPVLIRLRLPSHGEGPGLITGDLEQVTLLATVPARPVTVLVTGSRAYHEPQLLAGCLDDILSMCPHGVRVVHGGHPGDGTGTTSADAIARRWARTRAAEGRPVAERCYPAAWSRCGPGCPDHPHRKVRKNRSYCPLAGHRRNQLMVDAEDLDLCVAAPIAASEGPSAGTWDCVQRAETAAVPVIRVPSL
jgi:hypothetical protein